MNFSDTPCNLSWSSTQRDIAYHRILRNPTIYLRHDQIVCASLGFVYLILLNKIHSFRDYNN